MVAEISWTEQERGDDLSDNDEFDVVAAGDVTIHIRDSGNDSVTDRYFGFGRAAKSIVITPGATISLKKVNARTYKVPRTIVTDTSHTITKGLRIESFIITTETANTNVKVYIQ